MAMPEHNCWRRYEADSRHEGYWMNRAAVLLVLTLIFAADAIPTRVFAQSSNGEIVLAQNERGGFFRFLTRPFQRRPVYVPMPEDYGQQVRPRRQQDVSRPRRQRKATPAAPKVVEVVKAADAKHVLVIGDFMAGALAKGMTAAYAQNPNVV